jgi:hypothetical protein
MSKKCWIALPLITTTDVKDETVVAFLKGGLKKELENETAAFIMKWLLDKSVPFEIDFDSAPVDRPVVLESLPRRLQRLVGFKVMAGPIEEAPETSAVENAEMPAEEPGDIPPEAGATNSRLEEAAEPPFEG